MYKYTNRTRLGKIARTAKAPKTSFRNLIVTNVIYFVTNIVIHCFILLKKNTTELNTTNVKKVYSKSNLLRRLFFGFKFRLLKS